MKTKLPIGYIFIGVLGLADVCSSAGASVPDSPHACGLVFSVGLFVELLSPLSFYPSPNTQDSLFGY